MLSALRSYAAAAWVCQAHSLTAPPVTSRVTLDSNFVFHEWDGVDDPSNRWARDAMLWWNHAHGPAVRTGGAVAIVQHCLAAQVAPVGCMCCVPVVCPKVVPYHMHTDVTAATPPPMARRVASTPLRATGVSAGTAGCAASSPTLASRCVWVCACVGGREMCYRCIGVCDVM